MVSSYNRKGLDWILRKKSSLKSGQALEQVLQGSGGITFALSVQKYVYGAPGDLF